MSGVGEEARGKGTGVCVERVEAKTVGSICGCVGQVELWGGEGGTDR